MPTIRKSAERGHFRNEWLNSQHSFSFSDYYDPAHMGFSLLRVINDDIIAADSGFGTHPHKEMEIITYQVSGQLAHRDNTGSGDRLQRGDVQRMSAGIGITHSEFNPSPDEESRILQIWLLPTTAGVAPNYTQKNFSAEQKSNQLCLLVSADGRDGSLSANTDASLYASLMSSEHTVSHSLASDRIGYVQVVAGAVSVNGHRLTHGDALKLEAGLNIEFSDAEDAEFLLFDLPLQPKQDG